MNLTTMGLVEMPFNEMTETNGGCGRASNNNWRNFWNSYRSRKGCNHHTYQPPVCTPPAPTPTPGEVDPPPPIDLDPM